MFDWDDLRHFVALADTGSLSAAARRLRVEHATVARRVAALEAAAGVKLVDRRSGRYVLTAEGRRVADHARRIESEALALERALLSRQSDFAAEVSISAPPQIAVSLITPRLAELKQAHPQLRLRLLGESRTVSLPRREADIAIRLTRPSDTTLIARKAGVMAYSLYASKEYIASKAEKDFEFIAFDESLDESPHQLWLKKHAGERPIVFRSNDLAILAAAAQAHMGVAVLPSFVAESGNLQRIETEDRFLKRDVWITYHQDMRDNPAIATTAAFLAGCFRQDRSAADKRTLIVLEQGC
ncbi:LysR family transcriptional regulator [Microvirga vignae]|uniref:LysR family transcriptional regulator n=1 Tax=Microvirga vignae TaxID=1225564 RepID=A0A0H1R7L3_9HYPH|nr:LysR family transcriptional regulator [Microvirga vignae]KLK91240.1 LysR family transcriptional regulator [Microvirga vignae]